MTANLMPVDAPCDFRSRARRNVLVVGDVMLDEWIWGTVSRISPEAPVPVVAVSDHSFTLGGAGNVVKNLRCVRRGRYLCGDRGRGRVRRASARTARRFRSRRRRHSGVERPSDDAQDAGGRASPASRTRRLESTAVPSPECHDRIVEFVRDRAKRSDAVILSDYGKGLLSRAIVEAALGCNLVIVDPKPQNAALFRGVTCIAPNLNEAAAITGVSGSDGVALEAIGTQLLDRLECRYAVVTRGEHGMALFGKRRRAFASRVCGAHRVRRERRGRHRRGHAGHRAGCRGTDCRSGAAGKLRRGGGRRKTWNCDGVAG